MYAPSNQGEQPSVEVSKEFMMSPNKLHLEASLDKAVSWEEAKGHTPFSSVKRFFRFLSTVFTGALIVGSGNNFPFSCLS